MTAPSHRVLAAERGEAEGVLRVRVLISPDDAAAAVRARVVRKGTAPVLAHELELALAEAQERLLLPSLESELRRKLKDRADEEAIRVFAQNLEALLLAAPLGSVPVLAIDPGLRTGCKVAALNAEGDVKALATGAGGAAWYWHRVTPLLQAAGHQAVAVDLPGDDEQAGLDAYTELAIAAIAGRADAVLVAQSLGGFAAAMTCTRVPIAMLVFVNAMIPTPDETPGEWWGHTGHEAARVDAAKRGGYGTEFDLQTYFLHDVPPEVVAAGAPHQRPEADVVFASRCRFERWPDIRIRALGGVCALSRPRELVDHLLDLGSAAG